MKHNITKRIAALLLGCLLLSTTVFAAQIPEAPEHSCVLDRSGVLSAETERAVNEYTTALDKACGAQIGVLTVDFTDELSTADYAYEVFNEWGIGDARKNNGVLLLLAIGAEDYYCVIGEGLENSLSGGVLDDLLYQNLEPGFAAEDYDRGVYQFVRAMSQELEGIYGVNILTPGGSHQQNTVHETTRPDYAEESRQDKLETFTTLIVLLIVLLVVLRVRPTFYVGRRRWFGGYGGYGSGYRSGYRSGYNSGRRDGYSSGRSSGSSSFGGGHSSSSRSSFGGFSGGSSRGAGAGRRSSSGGGRPSGGGRRS